MQKTKTPPNPFRQSPPGFLRLLAASALVLATVLLAAPARAQQTTGNIAGRITEKDSGAPVVGLTVIAQGPQGEEAALTDDHGDYVVSSVPLGVYLIKVYAVGATAAVERPGVVVSAGGTVRVNLQLPRAEQKVITYVIKRKPPALDLGTARTALTLRADYLKNVPLGTAFGDAIARAPGAFVDRSGSVSIAGASGLENVYVVDGLNVTGVEFGDIAATGRANSSGGTNLPLIFVEELSIASGGYAAEFGGAMGGVINVVTKSGGNELHGSAYSFVGPSWLSGDTKRVTRFGSALTGRTEPRYDWEGGFEVGGPILRNRLFFWVGFAPGYERSYFVRGVNASLDEDEDGVTDETVSGAPRTREVASTRRKQWRSRFPYGLKLTFLPEADQRLNLSVFGSPSSSKFAFDRTGMDLEALADPRWAMQSVEKNSTDVVANWTGHFLERHWKLEASAGLHDERYRDESPYADLNETNQIEWRGVGLADLEGLPDCQPVARGAAAFDPCPVDLYRTGGYGALRSYAAQRFALDLKSTHFFSGGGAHELKYGGRLELATFDQSRHFSGPAGSRGLVQNWPGQTSVTSFFSLPAGRYPYQFADGSPDNGTPADLAMAPFYQDQLDARVKSLNPALFLQDSYSPLPNLSFNVGVRYEHQRLYDSHDKAFADLDNLAFRGGFLFDPLKEGRSKLFGHVGRFYEAVPLNMSGRYFGGEGLLVRNYDNSACKTPPSEWTGQGEWSGCPLVPDAPPQSSPYGIYNSGANYPVQPELQGQYHDEIVGGVQHEIWDGLVLGVEYTRRWLGGIIEDGTTADGTFVLANPGRVPDSAISSIEGEISAKEKELAGASDTTKPGLDAELGALKSKLANVKGLAEAPAPERTYNALTVSLSQKVARFLVFNASYTYARLYGNYNGLYDADNNYFAPNGNNAYDFPELIPNRHGPLANDRPHSFRLNGFYDETLGVHGLTLGLSFSAYSGVPRNHMAAFIPGQQLVFLLPRGSAGRTPTVTQLDAKLAYRYQFSKLLTLEAFAELFNVFNTRTVLRVDDNYTFDMTAPLVDGTSDDLPYAKNIGGAPVTKNPNFGRPTAYQSPFRGRLGLRATF